MKINFTKKQYEDLLKLAYLGSWMINAHKVKDKPDNFEELESYIFSFAKEFGMPEYLDDEVGDRAYPTRTFEEESGVLDIIGAYDEENFWEELVDHLCKRDLKEQVSEEEFEQMDFEERMTKMIELEKKWHNELEQYGLSRLRVVNMTLRTADAEGDDKK